MAERFVTSRRRPQTGAAGSGINLGSSRGGWSSSMRSGRRPAR